MHCAWSPVNLIVALSCQGQHFFSWRTFQHRMMRCQGFQTKQRGQIATRTFNHWGFKSHQSGLAPDGLRSRIVFNADGVWHSDRHCPCVTTSLRSISNSLDRHRIPHRCTEGSTTVLKSCSGLSLGPHFPSQIGISTGVDNNGQMSRQRS